MIKCLSTCLIKFESVTWWYVDKLLKARFIREFDENYPKLSLHMFAENESAMKRNYAVLNDLPGELYTIQAHDKIADKCKYPLGTI